MLTFSELERVSYISGDKMQADNFAKCDVLTDLEDNLPSEFVLNHTIDNQLDAYVKKQIELQCPNYAEYKQFFDTCFEMLEKRHQGPEVTSAYDCNVIFNAICAGESNENHY